MDLSSTRKESQEGISDHFSVSEEEKSAENKQERPVTNGEQAVGDVTEPIDLSNDSQVTEGAPDRSNESSPVEEDEDLVKEEEVSRANRNGDEEEIPEGGSSNDQPLAENGLPVVENSDKDSSSIDDKNTLTTSVDDASQSINPEDESQDESRKIAREGETESGAGRQNQQVNAKPASSGEDVTEADVEEEKQPASSGNGVTKADIEGEGQDLKPGSVKDVAAKEEVKEEEEEWQDILGNGLLKRRVLKQGGGRDSRPEKGQVVTLRTAGRMEDGTAVDWNHGIEFILGDSEVIPALDLVVALMEREEVCEVVTDSKYAYGQYGKQDNNPPIPPNANLTYELELLAVRHGPNIHTMKDEERIELGDKKRELGNDLYTRKDYSGAINCYQQALKFLGNSESAELQEVRIKCWNNLAAAQLKIKAYQAANNSCMEVLQIDKDNVKALFRRGKVLAAQGELVEALQYTKKASQLEPGSKTIRSELMQMRRLRAAQHQEERNLYQKMVQGLGKEEKSKSNGTSLLSWPFLLGATAFAVGGILAALYMTRH